MSSAENGSNVFAKMSDTRSFLDDLIGGKKNVIVISGHVHSTARAFQDAVNYYILGTGGAPDMNCEGNDTGAWLPLSNYTNTIYRNRCDSANAIPDFAYAKYTIDYAARQIKAEIISANDATNGQLLDVNTWNY